jgi:hypothetical protein
MSVSDFSGRLLLPSTGTLAAVVVEQGVDRLLQHSLFVANDDFGSVQVDQLAQRLLRLMIRR